MMKRRRQNAVPRRHGRQMEHCLNAQRPPYSVCNQHHHHQERPVMLPVIHNPRLQSPQRLRGVDPVLQFLQQSLRSGRVFHCLDELQN